MNAGREEGEDAVFTRQDHCDNRNEAMFQRYIKLSQRFVENDFFTSGKWIFFSGGSRDTFL